MSWSVNATGTPSEIREVLDKQFELPLADAPEGLSDEGEKTTVRHVQGTIRQYLETFDPEGLVTVSANDHMGLNIAISRMPS